MDTRNKSRKLIVGISLMCIGVLAISVIATTPVSAQIGLFQGRYEMWMELVDISFYCEFDRYTYYMNETMVTHFGSYMPYRVSHRPDYRLQSTSEGYIDISDQYTYSDEDGNVIRSETTYIIRLDGYLEDTFTSMYEYGDYITIIDNATLFEETYTERYYEDGVFQESIEYHEYTFLETWENGSVIMDEITVDAGTYECIVFDNYLFEGLDTDITDPDDYENYYAGGYLAWIDTQWGQLVEQWQFDENDDIVAEILLIESPYTDTPTNSIPSTSGPLGDLDPMVLVAAGGGTGAVVLVAAGLFLRSRRSSEIIYPGPAPSEF